MRARRVVLALLWALSFAITGVRIEPALAQTSQIRHPLDPLTADEIQAAARVLRENAQFPAGGLFSTIVLKEPAKPEVLGYQAGAPFNRQAFSIVLDRKANRTYEAVVDLKAGRVVSWNEVKGVQPPVLPGEYEEVSKIVKADPRWQAAIRQRGIEDFGQVQIDGWAAGQVAAKHEGPRLLRALSYFKGDQIGRAHV